MSGMSSTSAGFPGPLVPASLLALLLPLLAATARAQDAPAFSVALEALSSRSPRAGELVRCGCPLPRAADLKRPEELVLKDAAGEILPARVRTMSRWGGEADDATRPLRWVELTFAEPGRGALTLTTGSPRAGGLTLKRHEDGRTTLTSAHFALELEAGSRALLRSFAETGGASAGESGRLIATDAEGAAMPISPWCLEVVDASSCAVDLLASAELGAAGARAGQLVVELRIRAVSGSPQLVFDLRVVHRGPYPHEGADGRVAHFRRLALTLPTLSVPDGVFTTRIERPAGGDTGAGAGRPTEREEAAAGESHRGLDLALLQGHAVERGKKSTVERLPYQIWSGGLMLEEGERAEGALGVARGEVVIGIANRHFWQNAPRALSFVGGQTVFDFFPAGGTGPVQRGRYGSHDEGEADPLSLVAHRFEGARAKSTRLVLEIARPAHRRAWLAELAAATDRVLLRLPSARFIDESGALGYPAPPPEALAGAAVARFERLVGIFAHDALADDQSGLGRVGLPAFLERGGTWGRDSVYGWFDFGDVPWADGWCSLHYDMPFVVLLQALRRADPAFLDVGLPMARHRRDVDQDHDTSSGLRWSGGQFYEKGHWHGNYDRPTVSHTWVRGPVLHWWLTGDEGAREAAELARAFFRRADVDRWSGQWGARIPGWTLDALCTFHDAFGKGEDLELATRIAARVESIEAKKGVILNTGAKPPAAQSWMHAILVEGLVRHAQRTGSDRFHPLLARLRDTLARRAVVETAEGPRVMRDLLATGEAVPSVHHMWALASAFAACHELLGEEGDARLARRLFVHAAHHHQGRDEDPPIAFRMLGYPGSESKIMANIGLWGGRVLPLFRRSDEAR